MTQPSADGPVPTSDAGTDVDWAAVLQEHDRWLRTVIFSRLREREAVDDVMQEVALAAVKQSAPPRDASKVAPWLYQVAVRQSLLYRRTCGRRRKLTDRYQVYYPPSDHDESTPGPLDWLLSEERRDMLREALTRLPQRDAEILLLKYTEGWSYREISDHLGISQSAVEARLHRARKRLRSELAVVERVGLER